MQKRSFHPTFCSSRRPVSPRKEKPRKPLEEYGGYRKKTFLCTTTGTPPVPPYFGAVAAAR